MYKTLVGMEESAGVVIWRCSVSKAFWKIAKKIAKLPVLLPLFNEVSGLEICNVVK